MKTLFAALASVSLLTAPLALSPVPAMAQHSHGSGGFSHGGFSHGGFSHGGFGRGGFGHSGGYGWRGGGYGWRGGYGYGWGFGGLAAGLFLGAAIADSYDYPAYYGYWGPYGVPYPYDYDDGPPPPYADGDEGPPPPGQYSSAPPQGQACGSWSWDAGQSKYNWVPC